MTTTAALLLLLLVAGARAVPALWTTEESLCSTECTSPIGLPKLAYQTDKIYSYNYIVQSKILLEGVEGPHSHSEWSANVELKWLGPCDMAIKLKVDNEIAPADTSSLERYPLVVALTDGRVQHVCSHPDDDVWSINIKKGVASALQNSLPSLSSTFSGLNITETDVVGQCPTQYTVQGEADKIIVKEKTHRLCHERYLTPAETPVPWLQAPLPMEEANTVCTQTISNGIYKVITCTDKNVVRPSYGAYKYVVATQESTLQYLSALNDDADFSISKANQVHKSLRYEYDDDTREGDSSLEDELRDTMNQLCRKTEEYIEADAAPLVAKVVRLLRRMPEDAVEKTLQKIKGKNYESCQHHRKIESLFLDAVAFIHKPGAVNVMVTELTEGRATGGRAALYTAALHLLPSPCKHAIAKLKPLFELPRPMPLPTLAAASMVNRYCRHHPNCSEEPEVKNLIEALRSKLHGDCSFSSDPQQQEAALTTLKALGNMGVMTQEVSQTLLRCLLREEVKPKIRVAAAQAFRQAKCDNSITETLVSVAVNPAHNSEVRIASYLMAIRCVHQKNLDNIVANISVENNTQVRGFILSHLLNLQETNAPDKENLRYLLTNTLLPRNFTSDFRKYSRNIDLSYFAPSLGVGAGIESNVIYAPASFIPRSIDVNLTAALQGRPVNIAEVGARFEDLEPIIEDFFGPEGYLQNAGFSKIFADISSFVEKEGSKVIDIFRKQLRQKRSIDFSTISSFFNKIYGTERSRLSQADVFARFMGQEITFASLAWNMRDISADTLTESFSSYLNKLSEYIKSLEGDFARTAQLYLDYSFPTIQGTAFKLKLEGTAVAGLKMEGNLWGNGEHPFKFIPGLSVETVAFVGYDSYLGKTGIKMNNTLSSSTSVSIIIKAKNDNDFELKWDLPPHMDLINVTSETYLMKSVRGKPETKITLGSTSEPRIHRQSCFDTFDPVLGLKICYDINLTDIFRSNSLPLGKPNVAKLYMEKAEPTISGYLMNAAIKTEGESKVIKVSAGVEGYSSPRKTEMYLSFSRDSLNVSAKIDSPSVTGEVNASIVNSERVKSAETYLYLKANEKLISRGIKTHFLSESGMNKNEYCFSVFSSNLRNFPPDSQVIEGKFVEKSSGSEVSVEVTGKTMNDFKKYLDLHLEVETDLHYTPYSSFPYPTNLRKFEFDVGLRGWKMNSIFHKPEAREDKYTSTFKIAHSDEDLILAEASYTTEEKPDQNGGLKTAVVKLGSMTWKAKHEVDYQNENKDTSLTITRADHTIVDLRASAHPWQSYSVGFLVDEPEYLMKVQFEGKVAQQNPNQYIVAADLKYGDQNVLQVDGPLTVTNSPESYKIRNDIKVTLLDDYPYKLSSDVSLANNEQRLSLELRKQEIIFYVDWIMKSSASQQTKLDLSFLIPGLIDNKLTIKPEKVIHVNLDSLLLPQSSDSLRIKGFTDFDLEQKELKVNFTWDADHDERKIVVNAVMKSDPSHPGFVSIRGKGQHLSQWYEADILINDGGENNFKMEVKTPSQKTFALAVVTNIEQQSPTTSVTFTIDYKSLENKNYKLKSTTNWKRLGIPYTFMTNSQVKFTSPEGQETTVNTEAKHQIVSGTREICYKADVSSPVLRKPLHVHLSTVMSQTLYKIEAITDKNSRAAVFMWQLEFYPQGEVKSLASEINMTDIDFFLQDLLKLASLESTENAVIPSRLHERSKYRLHYHKPSPSAYSLLLQYPARTVQAEATYSPSQSSLTFYPDRDESDAKYEIGVQSSHSYWRQQSRYQGHISHPSLTRDVRAEVQYGVSGDNLKGTFKLDLFPDAADEITGELESTRISMNSMKIDGTLKTRVLQTSPKITVVTAYAPHTIGFNFMFKRTPSSQEAFQMAAQYDRLSAGGATAAFSVVTQAGPVVNISAVVEPEANLDFHGWKLEAVAHTPLLGTYDIYSKYYKPAFIEVITRKHDSEKQFLTKIGFQDPNNVEFSISEGNKDRLGNRQLAKTRVELATPNIVSVDMIYEQEEIEKLKDVVRKEWLKVTNSFEVWVEDVYDYLQQEAKQKGIQSPSSELLEVMKEVKQKLSQIYQELVYEADIAQYDIVRNILEGPAVNYIKGVYRRILPGHEEMLQLLHMNMLSSNTALKNTFKGLTDMADEVMRMTAQWVKTGELPQSVQDLLQQLQETSIFNLVRSEIDFIKGEYPEEYEAIEQVWSKVMDTLRQDLEKIRQKGVKIPAVESFIHWNTADFSSADLLEQYISELVQEAILVYWKNEGNHFVLNIPLHKPVYSLTQVLQEAILAPLSWLENPPMIFESFIPIPFKNFMWAYYKLLPDRVTDLVPPFNSTAMVVGDTEILTFDGTLLRVPRSSCEVLLAAYNSSKVIMAHPQPSAPARVTFIIDATNVTIEPDFSVKINGREMTSSQETEGDVTVYKRPQEIILMSPYMSIRVLQKERVVSLEVSGWTFGHLAGLLGTYDGEAGNDWLMPSGRRASSLQQLVRSWQEDQQCNSPNISPVIPSVERMVQCLDLLALPSRCYPLVPPGPFINMCYGAHCAQDASQAYRVMCSTKGVELMMP